MSDAYKKESRRLGLALVMLIVALAIQAKCSVTRADECHSGDLYVRGDEVVACVSGRYEAMLTLDESEGKARTASLAAGLAGVVAGVLVGAGVERGRREM